MSITDLKVEQRVINSEVFAEITTHSSKATSVHLIPWHIYEALVHYQLILSKGNLSGREMLKAMKVK